MRDRHAYCEVRHCRRRVLLVKGCPPGGLEADRIDNPALRVPGVVFVVFNDRAWAPSALELHLQEVMALTELEAKHMTFTDCDWHYPHQCPDPHQTSLTEPERTL